MNRNLLSAISDRLNRGSLNYTVFLDSLSLPASTQGDPVDYIRKAFGQDAVIEGLDAATGIEILGEVESSLTYTGYEGAGPLRTTLESNEFKLLLGQLIAELKHTIEKAMRIWRFRLSEGHPAYPVFWDFAFLFVLPDTVVILIGSSSD